MNDADRENLLDVAKSTYKLEEAAERNYIALANLDGFLRDAHDIRRRQGVNISDWLKSIYWMLCFIIALLAYIAYRLT